MADKEEIKTLEELEEKGRIPVSYTHLVTDDSHPCDR